MALFTWKHHFLQNGGDIQEKPDLVQQVASCAFTEPRHRPIPPTLVRCTLQGRVTIPLRQVIEQRRLHDTWQLQGAQDGTLTAELSWLSALSM
jgi:hypothetical protein